MVKQEGNYSPCLRRCSVFRQSRNDVPVPENYYFILLFMIENKYSFARVERKKSEKGLNEKIKEFQIHYDFELRENDRIAIFYKI